MTIHTPKPGVPGLGVPASAGKRPVQVYRLKAELRT